MSYTAELNEIHLFNYLFYLGFEETEVQHMNFLLLIIFH